MLQIRWEKEFQDSVHCHFSTDILEFGRSLRDGKQEYITLLISRFGIIRAMKSIFDVINSVYRSETLRFIRFCLIGISIPN
jgi:hypothetical protein